MARLIANPNPAALEDELGREFAPLLAARCLVAPGADGQAELGLFGRPIGAAATRYGGLFGGAQSAENFLLAQSGSAPDRPQRLVAAVSEGNYKAPVSVIGGTIALCELHRHVCTKPPRDGVEDDVRIALVESIQRIKEIELADPPHTLARWHFQSSNRSSFSPLYGLMTSFTALVVEGREALLAHVGECQAYRAPASGRSLERLSADHTLGGQPDFVRQHGVDDVPFADLPRWVLGGCQLSDIQLEWFRLDPGDTLLVCSSSLRQGPGSESQLAQLLADWEPAVARDRLMALAPLADRPDLSATIVILRPPI